MLLPSSSQEHPCIRRGVGSSTFVYLVGLKLMICASEFKYTSSELRSMRGGLDGLTHRLSSRSAPETQNINVSATTDNANHQIPTSNDALPDPVVDGNIATSLACELALDCGNSNLEFPFTVSHSTLPANAVSTAALEVTSRKIGGSKQKRQRSNDSRIKSCMHCWQHKVHLHPCCFFRILTCLIDKM